MGLTIQTPQINTTFNGPFDLTSQLLDESGVYAISTVLSDGTHYLLDVGESHKVRTRVQNHDRSSQWQANAVNGVYCSTFYCNESERMQLEAHLRGSFNLPCGIR